MRTGVPRPRGLARQVAVGRRQPGADGARRRAARSRACLDDDRWTYRFLRARANSIEGGRPRSSRTSSPSACSDCRGCDEVRARRRPAGDPAARPRSSSRVAIPPRRSAGSRRGRARLYRRVSGGRSPSSAGRRSSSAEDDGGLGLGVVELAVLQEQLGYALAPTPLLSSVAAALVDPAAGDDAPARRSGCRGSPRASAAGRSPAASRRGSRECDPATAR
jgi:hypothetical protein